MHDVCLVGVSGSGKGFLSDLMKPAGLDVRMFSARRFEPWLPSGLPPARTYVRAYKADAWQTLEARMFPYPHARGDATEAEAWRVFHEGWAAINAALDELPPAQVVESRWEDRRDNPQAECDRLADWLGVPRWAAPDIAISSRTTPQRVPFDPDEPTAERWYLTEMASGEGPRSNNRGPKLFESEIHHDIWPAVDSRPGGWSAMDLPYRNDICIVHCPAITASQHAVLDADPNVWDIPADPHRIVEPGKLDELRGFLRSRGISGRRVNDGASYAQVIDELFATLLLGQAQYGLLNDRSKGRGRDRPTKAGARAVIDQAKAVALDRMSRADH